MRKSMPARDASWSILLATLALDGPVGTLISWATRSSHDRIDDERILLAGTMLTWFLTTSHREVRDKATKALACLLTGRLSTRGATAQAIRQRERPVRQGTSASRVLRRGASGRVSRGADGTRRRGLQHGVLRRDTAGERARRAITPSAFSSTQRIMALCRTGSTSSAPVLHIGASGQSSTFPTH